MRQHVEEPSRRHAIPGPLQRQDLQGMRAVAVLTVFANHVFDWPSGGFVGVDIFFVLSGFFITGILIRERTATGKLSFRNFYVRRVKRILPSALLVLTVTVAGSYLLLPATRAKSTLLDALYASIFMSNIRFEALGADYFQRGQPPSPVLQYWSLSIEEQFYFVWPFMLVALFAISRRFFLREKSWAPQWTLFGAMGVIVTVSFGWATILTAYQAFGWARFIKVYDPNAAYFSTLTRVWELGVGALLAISAPWLARIPDAIRPGLAYLGLAGVCAALFLVNPTVSFPAPWAALPVLSSALVVASFHGAKVRKMFPLTNPVARWFGDTSYTLYLWHWPVMVFMFAVMPKGPLFYSLVLVLSLVLTAVTYHFYEDPIRRSGWLLDHSRQRVWARIGGVAAIAVAICIVGIGYSDKFAPARELDAANIGQADPCFGAPAMVNHGCMLWNPELPVRPSVGKFATDDQGSAKCAWFNQGEKVKSCTFGYSGQDATRIALVGDSHAGQLLPALWPLLEANKWQLTAYVGHGCAWRLPSSTCAVDEIQSELLARHYDLVLTTAHNHGFPAIEFQNAWAPVAAAGSRIAVIADNPEAGEEALACLTRVRIGDSKIGDCGTPRSEAFVTSDPLISAAKLVPGVTLIDLTPYYCTADRCPSIIGNVIVYRDEAGHLTATFARTLAPAIEDGLRRALAAAHR